MTASRTLVSLVMLAFAASALAQAQDGAAPSEGAIKGGSILPGESGGMPEGTAKAPSTEGLKRCYELSGTLRGGVIATAAHARVDGSIFRKNMSKSALELIPGELQAVALNDADVARAAALAAPTNQKVREAADARLRFEDEPALYLACLRDEADDR